MKAIAKILGLMCACAVMLSAALGSWLLLAQDVGSDMQQRFFAAVASEDPEELLALCRDDMRTVIDEPVLAVWMQAFNRELGAFQGLSNTDFNTHVSYTNGTHTRISEGTVNFQRGTAKSRIVTENGKIVSWQADTDRLVDGWFKGPQTNDLYRKRAEQFITRCLSGNTKDAHTQMHAELQKVVPQDRLTEMMDGVIKQNGALKSITFENAKMDFTEGQWLNVTFELEMENATMTGLVRFQFDGLQGHLLGFNFS